MGNPVPSQIRSVDPYASYDSNVVNHLTRMVSDGKNILLSPSPIDVSIISNTIVRALAGKAIVQDVLIEIQNIDVDLADIDFYINSTGGIWNEDGYYLIVLQYAYQKTSPPPEASIKIILPTQKNNPAINNPNTCLFLKCLDVSGNVVNDVLDYDPDNPAVSRDSVISGVSSGNFVATDANTTGLGASLYNVGSGDTDRFNKIYVKELMVETVTYTPHTSPPGSAVYGTSVYDTGTYGDIAENYTCDPSIVLETGTVVEMSDGGFEVQRCDLELSPFIVGVISAEPAYILNSILKDNAQVGLLGRIPTKVIGPVKKKDIMVSAGNGCLRAATNPIEYGAKVGISLETNSSEDVKLIECFIK